MEREDLVRGVMNINLFNKINDEVFGGTRYDDVVEKYGLRVIEKYMEFGEEGDLFPDVGICLLLGLGEFIRNSDIIRYGR